MSVAKSPHTLRKKERKKESPDLGRRVKPQKSYISFRVGRQGCFLWSSQKGHQQIVHECLMHDGVRLTLPPRTPHVLFQEALRDRRPSTFWATSPFLKVKRPRQPRYLCDDRPVLFGAAFHSDRQRCNDTVLRLLLLNIITGVQAWRPGEERKEAASLPRGGPVIRWSAAWGGHQSCGSNSDRTL